MSVQYFNPSFLVANLEMNHLNFTLSPSIHFHIATHYIKADKTSWTISNKLSEIYVLLYSDIYIKGDTTDHQEMAEMTEEHGSEEGGTAAEYYHHDGTEEGFMEGEQGYGVGEGEGDGGYAGNDGMQDDEEMCHGIFSTKDSGL